MPIGALLDSFFSKGCLRPKLAELKHAGHYSHNSKTEACNVATAQ
jgi:hypothetical protein